MVAHALSFKFNRVVQRGVCLTRRLLSSELQYVHEDYNTLIEGVKPTEVRIPDIFTSPKTLKNTYIGYRHGQSLANVAGIISSDFEIGR
jgi:hypothetical protein